MKKCICTGCAEPVYRLGFCRRDYRLWLAAGIPTRERENLSFDNLLDRVKETA